MKKFILLKTPELIFFNFVVFMLCFVWLRYFLPSFFVCLFLSLIICFCTSFFLFKFKAKQQTKQNSAKEKQQSNEQYLNTLKLSSIKNNTNYFFCLLSQKHKCTKTFISVVVDGPTTLSIYPIFKFEELCESDIAKVFSHKKEKHQSIILCDRITKSANILANQLNIIVYEKKDVFQLFENSTILPNKTILNSNTKINFKLLLKGAISKKRCKNYFIAASVLLLSSFLVPYRIYYLVFATILYVLSLVCLFPFSFSVPTKTEKPL